MSPFIERLALWLCLAVILTVSEVSIIMSLCVTVIVAAIQWVAVRDGREDGAYLTLQLPIEEIVAIKRELEAIEE